MKIALIAPIEESVPPKKYGGTEWIVYHLAHGLGQRGHSVDLYATGDSTVEPYYQLIPTVEKSIRTIVEIARDSKLRETKKLLVTAQIANSIKDKQYDMIHNHASWRFFLFGAFLKRKIVTTHHGPLSQAYQNIIFEEFKDNYHISISNNQRKDFPDLNFIKTIYNGIDLKLFPYLEDNTRLNQSPPMIFLARLSPEKGALEAAQVARALQKQLIVAAKVDTVDQPYFEKFKPFIDNKDIVFRGEIGFDDRYRLLQSSRCLLVPIQWEEPFGLMFTESMACGTPIVTFARGSAPEIIKDGQTGFLVNTSDTMKRGDFIVKKTGIEGLKEAVKMMYDLPREKYLAMRRSCRDRVEKNFTVEKMVAAYEEMYTQILGMEKEN